MAPGMCWIFPPWHWTPDPYVVKMMLVLSSLSGAPPLEVAAKEANPSHLDLSSSPTACDKQKVAHTLQRDDKFNCSAGNYIHIWWSMKYIYICNICIYIVIYGCLALPCTSNLFYVYPWAAPEKKGFGFESCWRVETLEMLRWHVQEWKENIYAFCPQKAINRQLGLSHNVRSTSSPQRDESPKPNLPQIQFLSHRCPSQLKPREEL